MTAAALAAWPHLRAAAPEVAGAVAASTAPLRAFTAVASDLRGAEATAARLEAVRLLRNPSYRGPETFKALSRAMRQDLNNEVRQAAAIALLDYEGGETLAAIEDFLNNELGEEVRRSVCMALATNPVHINNRGATIMLVSRLNEDSSALVRLGAVAYLLARQDASVLGDLKRAAQKDADAGVRAAAAEAYKKLSIPPKIKAPKPKKPEIAPYDAVKGKDHCPMGSGWCDCSRPPIKSKSRCIPREDCEHVYFNSYQRQGFSCTWNGEQIE